MFKCNIFSVDVHLKKNMKEYLHLNELRRFYRSIAYDHKIWTRSSIDNEWAIIHYNEDESIEKLSTDWFGYQNLIHVPTRTVVEFKKLQKWYSAFEGQGYNGTEFQFCDGLDVSFHIPVIAITHYNINGITRVDNTISIFSRQTQHANDIGLVQVFPNELCFIILSFLIHFY